MLRIKNMSKDQIIRLYEALLNLKIEESRFISTCDTLDLEYQMKFHEAFADKASNQEFSRITSKAPEPPLSNLAS